MQYEFPRPRQRRRREPRPRGIPLWVRETSSEQLHGIAGRMLQLQRAYDLSPAQEWLWDHLIAELEWRSRTTRPGWRRCSCALCIPPFTGAAFDAE